MHFTGFLLIDYQRRVREFQPTTDYQRFKKY